MVQHQQQRLGQRDRRQRRRETRNATLETCNSFSIGRQTAKMVGRDRLRRLRVSVDSIQKGRKLCDDAAVGEGKQRKGRRKRIRGQKRRGRGRRGG